MYKPEQDALYREILHLRDADHIRVETEYGLAVRYRLDGKEHYLMIE